MAEERGMTMTGEWKYCIDEEPEPGMWVCEGYRRDGSSYRGVCIFYPDGRWYSKNGHRIPTPEKWLDSPVKPWRYEDKPRPKTVRYD